MTPQRPPMGPPPSDAERWQRADDLLAAALEQPFEDRRAFVLAKASDRALADVVLGLLELEPETPSFLEGSAVEQAIGLIAGLEHPEVRLAAGERLGAYRLVEEIGRGGMSVVYLAERDDGRFHKQVAIKVLALPPHLLPASFRGRFQSERQILAQLEHPAIARLLDGGETEAGAPYLVMEYVQGQPIDVYCDRRQLPVEKRIALFLQVAEAVAHAHQNLVVHRDIKPSNVLVSETGEVKLLDFGIAKVLADGGDSALLTMTSERLMTPAYASPEQVRGDPIRTVSDVYSLGVLLYRLLTGLAPYGRADGPHEVAAAILAEEPTRPSAAGTTGALAAARASEPKRLRHRLQGDLDAIVLKALRKQPERRYPSVETLLDDLQRHLAGAPVGARGDDRAYRVRKFVRRNWHALAAVAVLLVVGSASAAYHARRIQTERDVARHEAATAEAVTRFVVSLFEASNAWGGGRARPETITARQLLEQGAQRIRKELSDQPEVRAELLSTLGSIHSSLGLARPAEALLGEAVALRRQLGSADSKATADDLERLALVHWRKGDYTHSERLNREAHELRRLRFGPDSVEAAASLVKIGIDLRKQGKLPQSEQQFREALRILHARYPGDHRDVAAAMKGLAMIRRDRGDVREAEAVARQALDMSLRVLGDSHPLTTEHRSDLATILRTKGDIGGAERLARQALDDTRAWFGGDHPNVALRWSSLGLALRAQGRLADAARAHEESVRIYRQVWGEEHPLIATNLHNLGNLRYDEGKLSEARGIYQQALDMRGKLLGATHPDVALTTRQLAMVVSDEGDARRAEPLLRQALDGFRRQDAQHPRLGELQVRLGQTLVRLGRAPEAEPLLRQAVTSLEASAPPTTHPGLALARAALGQCLLALGRRAEAAPLIGLAEQVTQKQPRDRDFVEAVSRQLTAGRPR